MSRAQFLASGLWWWCGNGFHDSCVQNWMCKHPLYGLALSPPFHVFIPTSASSFTRFHPLTFPPTISYYASVTLQCFGPHPWSPEALPVIKFTISVSPCSLAKSKGVWPGNHSWHSNWPLPIYHISFQVINIRTAHYSHWLTGIQEESPLQMSKTRMNSKMYLFQQNVLHLSRQRHDMPQNHVSWISREALKTGTWDEKSREIPCPSKLKEPDISNFYSSKHATLNCNYYCDCRWKTVFKTGVTSAEAPSLCRSWRPPRPSPPAAAWRSPRGRWMLQDAAESNLSTAGVGGTTCCGSPAALSSRAVAPGRGCSGRPRPRPSPGERRRPPCGRRLLPACSAAQADASPDLEESVEAAPVAAQVAPHRRQVAVARRFGDVVVSARGEMQQKWSSSVP